MKSVVRVGDQFTAGVTVTLTEEGSEAKSSVIVNVEVLAEGSLVLLSQKCNIG